MDDPRSDPLYLTPYLMGDVGVRGFLDRAQRRVGTISRAEWRREFQASCENARRALEQDEIDPGILELIEYCQRRLGARCDHNFRRLGATDSYTGDRVRECKRCLLVVVNDLVPDTRCDWCDGPAWRNGNGQEELKWCSDACKMAAHRARYASSPTK